MSEIEVGEYIRTKKGIIGKVEHTLGSCKFRTTTGHISKSQDHYYIDNPKQRGNISKLSITKHSKNIIDLIEVGDIVNILIGTNGNGEKITQKFEILSQEMIDEIKKDDTSIKYLLSILTHEQYEENCYKVGDIE